MGQLFSTGTQVASTNTGGKTSRTLPLRYCNTYRIKNQENQDAYCVIYDCAPKQDLVSGYDPNIQWANGYLDAQGAGTTQSTMSNTCVNAHPLQSERFKASWRILRSTKFMLAPGAQHLHKVTTVGNRVFSAEKYQSGEQFLKGWTVSSFIVVYGGPADTGATSSTVSTGSTKIIWTSDAVSSFKVVDQNSTNFNQANTLPTTIATETTMDEATGALALNAAA